MSSKNLHPAEKIVEAIQLKTREQLSGAEIAQLTGTSKTVVNNWWHDYQKGLLKINNAGVEHKSGVFVPFATTDEKPPTAKERLIADELNPPIDTRDKERIRELESEVARLTAQLTWAQHAESSERTGGKLTLRRSDDHNGDKNHLLSCVQSMQEKFLVLVQQYEPDEIQIVGWDDWIAGTGIYKNQDLDSVTSDVNEQVALGAIKTRRFLQSIRQVTDAPIRAFCLRGNHEYAQGVSVAESLFYQTVAATRDIANVDMSYAWDNITVNLAAVGTYNVLVRHGFGYSKHSPNSPAFIDAIKDELLDKQRRMQPHEQYQRVLSGHSHWLSVGLERTIGLYFDTTGGCQRNTRIRLGDNQRPVGWIVYVSPRGMMDDILRPLEIKPDSDTYRREIADPHLAAENQRDAADCVREFHEYMSKSGMFAESSSFGKLNVGRH